MAGQGNKQGGQLDDVAALVLAGRAAWPAIVLDSKRFFEFLREREDTADLGNPKRVADLYLVCACTLGDEQALAGFEQRYAPIMRAALGRMRLSNAQIQDVLQSIRQKLFVGEVNRGPKVGEYAGRGDLGNWLRIVAMRVALNMKRAPTDILVEDDQLLDSSTTDDDPELEYVKQTFRPAFRAAFKEALQSLELREQNLLRQHFIDGLSIDDLGPMYQVHRATAARWLGKAQVELLARTRKSLMKRTRASRSQCDSIMRQVHSRLDITMHSLFK